MDRDVPDNPPLEPRTGYDQWASSYDDADPTTALDEPILRSLCSGLAGKRVLDVGCGTGRYCRLLAGLGAEVVGIDLSYRMLLRARAQGDAAKGRWVQATSDRLPFADASFAAVVSGLLLDHVENLDPVFAELARVVVPGGLVVATTIHPEVQKVQGPLVTFKTHGREAHIAGWIHQPNDIVRAATDAGLAQVQQSDLRLSAADVAGKPAWRHRADRPALLLLTARRASHLQR